MPAPPGTGAPEPGSTPPTPTGPRPSRRVVLGGALLTVTGWASLQLWAHRPLPAPPESLALGASALRTLSEALDALLPEPDLAPVIAREIDAFLATGDPVQLARLRVALQALEHLGGAGPLRFTRFSRLPRAERRAVVERWRRSRWGTQRQIVQAIRTLGVLSYYARPEVWPRIGYDGPLVGSVP